MSKRLTNCLRVIRNAWHFYYALLLVCKVVCGGSGIELLEVDHTAGVLSPLG